MGKRPERTRLGPTRRKALGKALALYDEDTLMLAIEGCAASAFHRGDNDRQTEYCDLELILRDEAHIERFAADGERLRERVAAALAAERRRQQQAQHAPAQAVDAVEVQAQRERLRTMAARLAGRHS